MKRYILSDEAKLDLEQIWEYIADDDIDAADKVRNKIRDALDRVARVPGIGHSRRDVKNPRYRFLVVYSYVIAYFPDTKPLQIVRIVHGARNLKRLFKDR